MKKLMKLLYFLPAMILMIVIFYFSSQEAIASTETSTSIGRGIILIKASIMGEELNTVEIEEQALYIDHAVRKTAHATEYMILGIFMCFGIIKSGICCLASKGRMYRSLENTRQFTEHKKLKLHLISWGITALYACSDEIHQYFVPGRSAQVTDVFIDSIGALLGVIIYYLISRKIKYLYTDIIVENNI